MYRESYLCASHNGNLNTIFTTFKNCDWSAPVSSGKEMSFLFRGIVEIHKSFILGHDRLHL